MSIFKTRADREWAHKERVRHLNRVAHTYTGICPGCGDKRSDLCSLDDPALCGDCGLMKVVLGMAGVLIEKEPEDA